jgi:hypothetical protein
MTHLLKIGDVLSVTANASSSGTVRRVAKPGGLQASESVTVDPSTTVTFGPFSADRVYDVVDIDGALAVSVIARDDHMPRPQFANCLMPVLEIVPAGVVQTIPADTQVLVWGTMTVKGILTVLGTLIVPSTPTA